jgi:IMP dehydrogenase/GMP reductase
MESKKSTKSIGGKMYKNSPRIEHDEATGKKVIRKADDSKSVSDTAPEVKTALKNSMHDRHIKELEDLVKKHKKEIAENGSDEKSDEQEIGAIETKEGE